jgi:beta-glucanase (GH16 family)
VPTTSTSPSRPSPTTTPVPTTTPKSSTPACGSAPPAEAGVGSQWACTFDDEFDASTGDATSLNLSKWTIQKTANSGYSTGSSPYEPCYGSNANDVTVANGSLNLTVEQQASFACPGLENGLSDSTQYSAGMVSTIYGFNQQYGLYEVRAKIPSSAAPGLQETLWLEPVNTSLYGGEPAAGEIDFAEFFSDFANLDIPTIHYTGNSNNENVATGVNVYTNDTGANTTKCLINVGQYNTYAIKWSPGSLTTYYNGQPCFTDNYQPTNVASPAPFNQPFFISLTQALGAASTLGLTGPNNQYRPGTSPTSATTNIDYVRVWQSKG